jgi:hypothetical protein
MADNADRLRSAGLIADQPLPEHYYAMIEELSDGELEALVSLRERLERAGIPTTPLTAPRAGGDQCIVVL